MPGLALIFALAIGLAIASRRGASGSVVPDALGATVKNQGVPFAISTGKVWPVVTTDPNRLLVPYLGLDGKFHPVATGNRYFGASRQNLLRRHAAIDLVSRPGDTILATEDGRLLGPVSGYGIGAGLDAVAIDHGDKVVVYAEIVRDPTLADGQLVTAGQRIGIGGKNSSGNSMLHFETWAKGHAPKMFTPWWTGKPAPEGLLDPTRYLLDLAKRVS